MSGIAIITGLSFESLNLGTLTAVAVTSVTVSGADSITDSGTLTATVLPANASNKRVNWTSSDESKAVIDGSGNVTVIQTGTVTFTATSAGNPAVSGCKSVSCVKSSVIVPVTGVELSGGLEIGGTKYAVGTAQLTANVLPVNATDKSLTWLSSDSEIAAVDANGLVTVNGNGQARITAVSVSSPSVMAYVELECRTGVAEEVSLVAPNAIIASGSVSKSGGDTQLYTYGISANRASINETTGTVSVLADADGSSSCDVAYTLYRVTSTSGAKVAVDSAVVPTILQMHQVDLTGRIGYMPYVSNKLVNAKTPVTLYAEFVLERGTDGASLLSDRISGKNHCVVIARFGSRNVTADGLGGALMTRIHKRDDTYSTAVNDEVGSVAERTIFSYSDNNTDGATLFDGIAGANVSSQNYNNETANCFGFNYEYPKGYATDSLPDITGMTAAELTALVAETPSLVKSGEKTVKLKRLVIHETLYSTVEELLAHLDTASVNLVGTNDGRLIQMNAGAQPVLSNVTEVANA